MLKLVAFVPSILLVALVVHDWWRLEHKVPEGDDVWSLLFIPICGALAFVFFMLALKLY